MEEIVFNIDPNFKVDSPKFLEKLTYVGKYPTPKGPSNWYKLDQERDCKYPGWKLRELRAEKGVGRVYKK
jgi:hypothetical protein